MKAKMQENTTRYEGEIQQLLKQLGALSHPSRQRHRGQIQDNRSNSSVSSSSSSSSSTSNTGKRLPSRVNSMPVGDIPSSVHEGKCSSSEEALNLLAKEDVVPMVRLVTCKVRLLL